MNCFVGSFLGFFAALWFIATCVRLHMAFERFTESDYTKEQRGKATK